MKNVCCNFDELQTWSISTSFQQPSDREMIPSEHFSDFCFIGLSRAMEVIHDACLDFKCILTDINVFVDGLIHLGSKVCLLFSILLNILVLSLFL